VHHPRIDPTCGYFIIGEFDPHSDRAGKKGFSFDFDAIEVLNGYQDPAPPQRGPHDRRLPGPAETMGIWPPPPETRTPSI